jgi:hypothetical protein
LPLAIVAVLLVMMYRSSAKQRLNNIAYAMIIGGALGNLFDRLWHGFVIDFHRLLRRRLALPDLQSGGQLYLRGGSADRVGRLLVAESNEAQRVKVRNMSAQVNGAAQCWFTSR